MHDNNANSTWQLRHMFVGFLFAFAISTVATTIAAVFRPWIGLCGAMLVLAHEAFATSLITCSWVGWSQSQAAVNQQDASNIFSVGFVVLIVDVFLVIVYTAIAATAEVPYPAGMQINGRVPVMATEPSAFPEAVGALVVFCIYLVWDVIADVYYSIRHNATGPISIRDRKGATIIKALFVFGSCSLVCLGGAVLVLIAASGATHALSVIFLDCALIVLVFFFRLAKSWEPLLGGVLPKDTILRAKVPRDNSIKHSQRVLSIFFLFLFLLFALLGFEPKY